MSYSVTNAYHAQTAAADYAVYEMRSITRVVSVRTGLNNDQARAGACTRSQKGSGE